MNCESCSAPMLTPHMLDADERALCAECSGYVCALGCNRVTDPSDRLPWMRADGGNRVACSSCAFRLSHALGLERSATLLRRSGPAFCPARPEAPVRFARLGLQSNTAYNFLDRIEKALKS